MCDVFLENKRSIAMIKKERLQEIIDQKATIYELCDEEIFEIDFSKLTPNQFYDDGFNVKATYIIIKCSKLFLIF